MGATTNFTTVTLHLHRQIALLKWLANLLRALVEEQFENALKALTENDLELVEKVIKFDKDVDEREITLEEDCLKIIVLYQPVAVASICACWFRPSRLLMILRESETLQEISLSWSSVAIKKTGRELLTSQHWLRKLSEWFVKGLKPWLH